MEKTEKKYSECKDFKELLFTALGEVSMCWSEIPKGVFDSSRANELGNMILAQYEADKSSQPVVKQLSERDKNLFEYLLGESEIDGKWFGDTHEGQFFWRTQLRELYRDLLCSKDEDKK